MSPRFQESYTLTIDATPKVCYEAMIDFESYPQWQKAVKRTVVKSRENDRVVVECFVDLLVKEIRYTLDYRLDPKTPCIRWTYVEGDAKNVSGDFQFEAEGKRQTRATYTLDIDPGIPVPKLLINKIKQRVMRGVVHDLKRRVEG